MSTLPLSTSAALILVIDDNPENLLLLATQLGMEGYRIVQAKNGAEGIKAAQNRQPDLILLDVMMPDMSGFEVCTRLKADPQTAGIPVIMVTALREVEYRIRGIEAGADEFLSRPHHREELLLRVRALIQLQHTRKRLEEERNRLQLLYSISRAIATQLDLEQVMADILAKTQAAVGATKGSIMLVDAQLEVTHRILIRSGLNPEVADRVIREVMQRGLAGWLVRHNRGTIIANAAEDNRWLQLPDDEDPAGSVIGVPLSRVNRVVGVLILAHQHRDFFTQEHLALLETIGVQITASIENAYLFAEIIEERGKLGAILSQSSDAIITTDESWRITLINQAAKELFRLRSNVIGRSLLNVPRLDDLILLFNRVQQEGAIASEINLDDGSVLYTSISPIPGVGFVAVSQDITELKRAEEFRLRQERREKALVKETFSRYMGPRLVDYVLSNEPGLLARRERRKAVVLFADLRDFTRLIVNTVADQAIYLLNDFFSQMTDIVYEFDGTIFDLTGDEIMVGFNVPIDQPDAAHRALMAAISMQKRFDRLRHAWRDQLGVILGLGIGIDQGIVVVGNVGAESRMTFRMVGEAVNIAHRLVDLAEDGQIVITNSVLNEIRQKAPEALAAVGFTSMGQLSLKGKASPVPVFRGVVERTPFEESAG
jgi:PAS domain S-box-containing protein